MEISSNLIRYINIIVVVYMICVTLIGFKRGLFRQIFSAWGGFLGIIIFLSLGYLCCGVPVNGREKVIKFVADNYLNFIFWFFGFVITMKILLMLYYKFLSRLFKQRKFGNMSRVMGAIVACINGFVTICVMSTILSLPLFSNGEDIVDGSLLIIGKQAANVTVPYINEMILEGHSFLEYKEMISKDTDKLIELEKIFNREMK